MWLKKQVVKYFFFLLWRQKSSQPLCHRADLYVCDTLCFVLFAVMNGHTTCVRLLLDESDNSDLVDVADSQGQ